MYRFNNFSKLLLVAYVLVFIMMQIGANNSWTEGFTCLPVIMIFVLWSEKNSRYGFEAKTFNRDLFIISYSFLLAFVVSLAFQINNSDVRGWWPFIIMIGSLYAILSGLVFSIIALLLNSHHVKYSNRFALTIFWGYLALHWIPPYLNIGLLGQINIFYMFLVLLFSIHSLMCLSYRFLIQPRYK